MCDGNDENDDDGGRENDVGDGDVDDNNVCCCRWWWQPTMPVISKDNQLKTPADNWRNRQKDWRPFNQAK